MNFNQQFSKVNLVENPMDNPVPNKKYIPKKKYSNISSEIRKKFIQKVISKEKTMVQAAKDLGLKFSTGKAILRIFKKYGRIGKKPTRDRRQKVLINIKDQIKTEIQQKRLTLQDFGPFGQQFLFCQSLVNLFFSRANNLQINKKIQSIFAFMSNLQELVSNPELNIRINELFRVKKSQLQQQQLQQQQLLFLMQQPKLEQQVSQSETLLFSLFQKNNLLAPYQPVNQFIKKTIFKSQNLP